MKDTNNQITFEIETLQDLITETKRKEALEKSINIEFTIAKKTSIINLTKDILINVIPNKLKAILEQLENPEVIALEKNRDETIKSLEQESNQAAKERDSILSILTSQLNLKKEVLDIKHTKINLSKTNINEAYVAQFGSFDKELEDSEHTQMAKRYLELINILNQTKEQIEKTWKQFDQAIKDLDIDYIPRSFNQELSELNKISNLELYYLKDLQPELYYELTGSSKDYQDYQIAIKTIQELYGKIQIKFKDIIL